MTKEILYPVNTSVPVTTLATIARYWEKQGHPVRSLSEVIRLSLDTLVEFLSMGENVEFISDPIEANEELKKKKLLTQGMQKRGRTALLKHLQEAELTYSGMEYPRRTLDNIKKAPIQEDYEQAGRQILNGQSDSINLTDEIRQYIKDGLNDGRKAAKEASDLAQSPELPPNDKEGGDADN